MRLLRKLLRYLLQLLRGRRSLDFRAELEFETQTAWSRLGTTVFCYQWSSQLMATLDVTLGDTGTHTAVLTVTNLDGTHAEGVTITYSSDNPAVATVDASSGMLTLVGVGSANITGTGTRGTFTHADSGTVAVALSDDFTATLTLA